MKNILSEKESNISQLNLTLKSNEENLEVPHKTQ